MILYFADRKLNVLGHASNRLPRGLVVSEDLKTEDIETGVSIFECTIQYNQKSLKKIQSCVKVGNYLLRRDDGKNEFYTIIDVEKDTKNQAYRIYAEDAGLDLLNEIAGPYEADRAYPIDHYINMFADDSGFIIGINEASDLSRKLSWDGEATVAERIRSVATQFDGCEISYSFAMKGLVITNKYINIHKRRGKDIGIQLRMNREIDNIVAKESIANLATALMCTGGTPEPPENADTTVEMPPITLKGYKYDDGDFYVDGEYLKSRKALAKWSRYILENEPNQTRNQGHITKRFSYDTLSQQELCAHAVSKLKKLCEIEYNYEVDIKKLPDNVQIGDRVVIVDDLEGLYLSTRLLKLETSVTDGIFKGTFGEFLFKSGGISKKVEELAEQFKNLADSRVFYTWIAYADDEQGTGITLEPNGKKYIGVSENRLKSTVDISNPKVFKWSLIKGDDAVQLQILSSNGNIFKNSMLATTLTVSITTGGKTIESSRKMKQVFGQDAYLEWEQKRFGENEFTKIQSNDPRLSDNGFILTITTEDVETHTVFNCKLNY